MINIVNLSISIDYHFGSLYSACIEHCILKVCCVVPLYEFTVACVKSALVEAAFYFNFSFIAFIVTNRNCLSVCVICSNVSVSVCHSW